MEIYPEVDLSVLLDVRNPVAVNCRTEWEASAIIFNALNQYPQYIDGNIWRTDNTSFDKYESKMCYSMIDWIYDNATIERATISFDYCDVDWHKSHGYKVVRFDELPLLNEPNVNESELDLDLLLK